jgi:hypothetical protein
LDFKFEIQKAVLKENEPSDLSGHAASDNEGKVMQPVPSRPWVLAAKQTADESSHGYFKNPK